MDVVKHALPIALGIIAISIVAAVIEVIRIDHLPSAKKPAVVSVQTANVAYAGSLQLVSDQYLAPAFERTTGDHYRGRGGGSYGVAHLIAAREIQPNAFMSIGTGPLRLLQPRRVRFAIGFASAPLVVAFAASSPYAAQLRRIQQGREPLRNLFLLMARPGFQLGRTNPKTDPQGQAFIMMVHLALARYHLPASLAARILGPEQNPRQIFAEESILSRLQAGQLDASSAFLPEAVQRHLDYIALPPAINFGDPGLAHAYARATLSVNGGVVHGAPLELYVAPLAGEPDAKAGTAWTRFMLSATARRILREEGYSITKPTLFGHLSAARAALGAAALHDVT
jgi:molybdate/tungstate transport system substrate-binding protein